MLVVVGATGDLCKRKIFPALNAMLRTVLYKCVKTEYIKNEIDGTPGTLSSSVSHDALQESPLTHAKPSDGKKYLQYHKAEEDGVVVKKVPQSSIIKESEIRIPRIVGYARTPLTTAEFIRRIDPSINYMKETVEDIEYVHGPYEECLDRIQHIMEKYSTETVYVYMAVPPEVYSVVIEQVRKRNDKRIVLLAEKPHGTSLESYHALREQISGIASRFLCVDHYLHKNVVKQMPHILETSICGQLIAPGVVEQVHAYFKEQIGVEGRVGYFNAAGMCRDVLQNHLLQCISAVLSHKTTKLEVLKQIAPLDIARTKFGVYKSYGELLKQEGIEEKARETYIKTETQIGGEWNAKIRMECGKKMKKHNVGMRVYLNSKGIDIIRQYSTTSADYENTKAISKTRKKVGGDMVAYVDIEITPKEYVRVDWKYKNVLLKRIHVGVERAPHGSTPYQAMFMQLLMANNVEKNFAVPEEVEEQWRIVEPVIADTNREITDIVGE